MANFLHKLFSGAIDEKYQELPDGAYAPVVFIGGQDLNSVAIDAFGRQRVSNPVNLFDTILQYDDMPIMWEDDLTAGGTSTHLPNESMQRLRVASNGDIVIRQSRVYTKYQPAKSQLIAITGVLGPSQADVTQRMGYFDADNGVYLEQSEDGLAVTLRSSTSGSAINSQILQADWNLDTLDGNGVSGITLDPTTTQIFMMDLQWLGVGRVRVGFNIGGTFIGCHEFLHANNLTTVYMTTAVLPIRYEIRATGAGAAQTDLLQICSSVTSEGGLEEELGFLFSASNGATTIAVSTRRPILSIRPRALFNSIVNRVPIVPEGFSAFSEDNPLFYEIVYGGTLTNASFANVDATHSVMEEDVAATAISGGIVIDSGYVAAGGIGSGQFSGIEKRALLSRLPLSLDISGSHPTSPLTDSLSLVATAIDTATDTSGGLHWRELR